ncbi:MAG: hypothetical protein NTX61_01835 [Bacteroidetes bacterium]|nr:hypothetical protein [Bacteroidota bacterium]
MKTTYISNGKIFIHIVFVALLTFESCNPRALRNVWVYKPNEYIQSAKIPNAKKVLILPFEDQRERKNHENTLLFLCPLMPFGYEKLSVPEQNLKHVSTGDWSKFDPRFDFATALSDELRKTGYFQGVHASNRNLSAELSKTNYFTCKCMDENYLDTVFRNGCDYIITGKILNTNYFSTVNSYGLSFLGPLLWIIGFPAGSASNELSVNLNFIDNETKQIMFSKTYSIPKIRKILWLYNADFTGDFYYPRLLADIYKQFCTDLEAYLPSENLFISRLDKVQQEMSDKNVLSFIKLIRKYSKDSDKSNINEQNNEIHGFIKRKCLENLLSMNVLSLDTIANFFDRLLRTPGDSVKNNYLLGSTHTYSTYSYSLGGKSRTYIDGPVSKTTVTIKPDRKNLPEYDFSGSYSVRENAAAILWNIKPEKNIWLYYDSLNIRTKYSAFLVETLQNTAKIKKSDLYQKFIDSKTPDKERIYYACALALFTNIDMKDKIAKEIIPFLIQRIDESDNQATDYAVRALESISSEKFGHKKHNWETWWNSNNNNN